METGNKGKYPLWMVVLSLLAFLGFGAWIYQVSSGLIVTGMRNVVSWGLYITSFMFFVGLSAGGLIVSSSATVFNIPAFKAVDKPAVILSTVCIVLAALFIIVDLGSPERILYLILHPQFKSPLIWDVIIITCYFILSVLYLRQMARPVPDPGKMALLSRIALPVAILVHSVTAWIFGLQIARLSWHSALMAPLFVSSALDSGLALLLIVLWGMERQGMFSVPKKLLADLAALLAVFIAIDAFFVFCEMLTILYPAEDSMMSVLGLLLNGSLAPLFWFEILLGLVFPFYILASGQRREQAKWTITASVFVVLGVFCKRAWLLLSSFVVPLVGNSPGITLGQFREGVDSKTIPNIWAVQGMYFPSLIEILIFAGILSLGALLFIFATRRFLSDVSSAKPVKSVNPVHAQPEMQ